MKNSNEKSEIQSTQGVDLFKADPFHIMWIPPDYPGNNNGVRLQYRGKQIIIPSLTHEHYKTLVSFRDKLRDNVFSDWDYSILVPEILNPSIFSVNEIAMLSNIMTDWVRATAKAFPDKKEDLTELKKFVNKQAKKVIKNSNQTDEPISAPEIKKIKDRYALLLELGIIDYLHNTYPKLYETKIKKQLISMITGFSPAQLHLYVTYEKDESNANYPLGENNKIGNKIWDELKRIGIEKPIGKE